MASRVVQEAFKMYCLKTQEVGEMLPNMKMSIVPGLGKIVRSAVVLLESWY